MVRKNKSRESITLIGSGNLAQALGPALHTAGYTIDAIAVRNAAVSRRRASALAKKISAKVVDIAKFAPESSVIWLCHRDDALAQTAQFLAGKPGWKGKIVFHSSGALTSDVLSPLRHVGTRVASVHPMMTFVAGKQPRFTGIALAVEGDAQALAAAKRIGGRLGAEVFTIRKKSKVLYHAFGSFSSPLLVATLAMAERVGRAAGLSSAQLCRALRPILERTIKNYLESGPAAAFSGPIKRGDVDTVRRHLRELRNIPEAREVYVALMKSALRELPAKNAQRLRNLLKMKTYRSVRM